MSCYKRIWIITKIIPTGMRISFWSNPLEVVYFQSVFDRKGEFHSLLNL